MIGKAIGAASYNIRRSFFSSRVMPMCTRCRRVVDMASRDGELRVFLVAGEVSGDSIASRLMISLKKLSPVPLRFAGVGGVLMYKEGMQSLFPMEDISVMGIWELLPHLNKIRMKLKETVESAILFRPHVVVTVDSKGFSFRFLRQLKDRYTQGEDSPIHVHYVAPSFWAWKGGETGLKRLCKFVDHVLCILPFEEEVCRTNGLAATFVGHPLLEDALNLNQELDPSSDKWKVQGNGDCFRREHGLSLGATVITLLPGSRLQEVTRMLPIFAQTVELLKDKFTELVVVIPVAPNHHVESYINREIQTWTVTVILISGASFDKKYDSFNASRAALSTSGTAVMELQLARLPCVVAYRAHFLTEWLIQYRTKLHFMSLPNILLDSAIIPEALFRACTSANLASLLRKMPRVIDPAWAHGMAIAGQRHKIKCNYCGKIINRGITRLKEHLAHRTGQVIKCTQVPKEVKMEMLGLLEGGKKKKHEREDVRRQEVDACREEVFGPGTDVDVDEDDFDQELSAALRESIHTHHLDEEGRRLSRQTGGVYGGIGGSSRAGGGGGLGSSLRRAFSTRRRDSYDVEEIERSASRRPYVEAPADPFAYRKAYATQTGIKSALSGMGSAAKKAVYKATGKFFLHNRIPPSVASSLYLQTMFDAAIEHGKGLKAPTPYDIGHHCVQDEYKEAIDWVATFKQSWIDKGCTIMCDGWTSINRRSLINFMVYSPNGTVFYKSVNATEKVKNADYILSLMEQIVDDIGEESVLQIVTDNEATYKAAGLRLMKTRKHLFWSPCAAHCVDLMIEEIAKKKWVAAVIENPRKSLHIFTITIE